MSKISNLSLLDEFFQAPINQSIYLSIYQSIRDCLYSRATYFKVNCLYKECTKTRFRLGLGTYDAPPGSQVGWGGGHSLTIPFPHYAFRVSVLWFLKTEFLATPMPRLRVGLVCCLVQQRNYRRPYDPVEEKNRSIFINLFELAWRSGTIRAICRALILDTRISRSIEYKQLSQYRPRVSSANKSFHIFADR